uniref:Putative secreted peptide n=1 Tax=Anopheles braziliensis TaxID=58242 RepID=A0A2M3ZSD3_9DIPT
MTKPSPFLPYCFFLFCLCLCFFSSVVAPAATVRLHALHFTSLFTNGTSFNSFSRGATRVTWMRKPSRT